MAALFSPINSSINSSGNSHGLSSDNSSFPAVLLDELWNNLTNREELLRRWTEKLRLEREEQERMVLNGFNGNGTDGSEQITETSLSFPPDSIWPLLWIALYAAVLIVIIVVAIKACILLFEKTDDAKFDDSKDSPNILRMAVAGRNRGNSLAAAVPVAVLEHQRSISPRSVILQQPTPNSTRPCYIYNAGAYNAVAGIGVGLPNSAGSSAGTGSCSWTHPFIGMAGMGAAASCCSKAGGSKHSGSSNRRLLRSSGRGVSLESELMMTPCGTYYLHHSVHNPHTNTSPHHHSQQQLCTMTMNVTPPTATAIAIPGAGASPGSVSAGSRCQRQYQYQHQHTNDSSLQWDSLNTNTTDHSGESPPSYEIALGVEIASRPQSGMGDRNDQEGESTMVTAT